ncbi:hypothetical protein [Mangrovactinospora gilvigrisea]|uniref:hypothetical protein n=1 Tax=Mangrovactinospora gilvigrisea TaxID=1428644 RepID=UPI000B2C37E8|nr:hypothetical protein [Mangrovactinospora gilvigrisea]
MHLPPRPSRLRRLPRLGRLSRRAVTPLLALALFPTAAVALPAGPPARAWCPGWMHPCPWAGPVRHHPHHPHHAAHDSDAAHASHASPAPSRSVSPSGAAAPPAAPSDPQRGDHLMQRPLTPR